MRARDIPVSERASAGRDPQEEGHPVFSSTLGVLVPVLFVLALGYFAGRAKNFDADQAAGITELTLDFALPASLFVGIVSISRTALAGDVPFVLAVAGAMIAVGAVSFVIARMLGLSESASVIFMFGAAVPASVFFGPAVLGPLFGANSVLAIASVALVSNLIMIPVSTVVLELARRIAPERGSAPSTGVLRVVFFQGIVPSIRKPYVWVPMIALLLVVAGVRVPPVVDSMLNLIGGTTAGLSLFAVGLTLSAHAVRVKGIVALNAALKMIAQPALMLGLAALAGIHGMLAREAVVDVAFPAGFIAPMLAARYKVYESEASSTLVVTVVLMMIVVPLFLAVAH